MSETKKVFGILAGLGLAFSFGLAAQADGEIALKNITADANHQIVVQFAAGAGSPATPKIVEVKEPNHQLFIEFANVVLDDNAPAGDQLSKTLRAKMPGLRAARVGIVPNAETPTVRVILDLDPDLVIKPSLTNLQEGVVVVGFGDDYTAGITGGGGIREIAVNQTPLNQTPVGQPADADEAPAAAANSAAPAAAKADASTDPTAAYEEYYRKFLAQKQMNQTQPPVGEWGPRKGTMAEVKAAKGVRIIGTPLDSPDLSDVKPAAAPAPATTYVAKRKAAAAAAVAAPVAEEAAEAEAEKTAEAPVRRVAAAPTGQAARAAAAAEAEAVAAPAVSASELASQSQDAPEPSAATKDESPAMQPDVVAEVTPPVRPRAVSKVKKVEPADEALSADESAASPADAAAAAAGASGAAQRKDRQQDLPENEVKVTTPQEDEAKNESDSPRKRAIRLYNEAHKNHLGGHVDQAMAQYKQAIKIDPDLVEAHSDLGLAYNQQHNYGSALIEFRKALALNPLDAYTYNGLGAALRAQHDNVAAIKNWETAVRLDPRLAAAHYNLGTAYEAEGDLDRALVSYEDAVKNDGHFGEAFFRMGLILQQRHRLSDARINFRKALKISADSDYAEEARTRIARLDKVIK